MRRGSSASARGYRAGSRQCVEVLARIIDIAGKWRNPKQLEQRARDELGIPQRWSHQNPYYVINTYYDR